MNTLLLRRSLTGVAVLCALAVSSERAEAQTETKLYACYVPLTGTVYRIRETNLKQTCTTGHVEFNWNAEGAQGPQGIQGVPGPQGPPGPAGAGGALIAGLEIVQANFGGFFVTPTRTGTVTCPANKVVIGGGFSPFSFSSPYVVRASFPFRNPSGTEGWTVEFADYASWMGYAICVNR